MVCGLKQGSGSNIGRKQHEMKLIFMLGTLRPDFNFEPQIQFIFILARDIASRITFEEYKAREGETNSDVDILS